MGSFSGYYVIAGWGGGGCTEERPLNLQSTVAKSFLVNCPSLQLGICNWLKESLKPFKSPLPP